MAINYACPNCKHNYRIRDEYAGQTWACRSCGSAMDIPDQVPPTPAMSELPAEALADPAGRQAAATVVAVQNENWPKWGCFSKTFRFGCDNAAAAKVGNPSVGSGAPSLILSLVGLVMTPFMVGWLFALPAVWFGKREMKRRVAAGVNGAGVARAGYILGWLGLTANAAIFAAMFAHRFHQNGGFEMWNV